MSHAHLRQTGLPVVDVTGNMISERKHYCVVVSHCWDVTHDYRVYLLHSSGAVFVSFDTAMHSCRLASPLSSLALLNILLLVLSLAHLMCMRWLFAVFTECDVAQCTADSHHPCYSD